MLSQNYSLQTIRQDLLENNMQTKAIIQDINNYRGTIAELEELNEAGRAKLAALRNSIELLDDWAKDTNNPELIKEMNMHRDEFAKTLQAFRQANVTAWIEIEKANREELMALHDEGDLRRRKNASRYGRGSLVSQENSITEKMLSISQHLSETTQKSAATLETLVASSQNVHATKGELQMTAGTISQSGKLLNKYGRREWTDKILVFFAFIFFLACVLYIVQKRLF